MSKRVIEVRNTKHRMRKTERNALIRAPLMHNNYTLSPIIITSIVSSITSYTHSLSPECSFPVKYTLHCLYRTGNHQSGWWEVSLYSHALILVLVYVFDYAAAWVRIIDWNWSVGFRGSIWNCLSLTLPLYLFKVERKIKQRYITSFIHSGHDLSTNKTKSFRKSNKCIAWICSFVEYSILWTQWPFL